MSEPTPGFLAGESFKARKFAFKFDEEQAFRKLRDFRVAEPERYVLEFVLAACESGATRLDVDPGAWSTTLRFDGRPFTHDELSGLYHHLMEQGEGGDGRLAHLASGLVVLSHLEPRQITIRSGTVQLVETFDNPTDPQRTLTEIAPVERTEIEVARRREFKPLMLLGFRETSEEAVIRARVLFCPIELYIRGGRLAPHSMRLFASQQVETDYGRGFVGLTREYELDVPLHICYGGVLVKTRTFKGIGGVLSSRKLKRNISLNDVVDDNAYQRLVGQASKARRTLEAELIERLALHSSDELMSVDRTIHRLTGPMLRSSRVGPHHPAGEVLMRLPMFQTTDGSTISLAELTEELEDQSNPLRGEPRLFSVSRGFLDRQQARRQIRGQTLILPPQSNGIFAKLSGLVLRHFKDVSGDLKHALAREAFFERPEQTLDVPGAHDAITPIESGEAVGVLTLNLDGRDPSAVRLLHHRRGLGKLAHGFMPGVYGVVDCPHLQPNKAFATALKNDAWKTVHSQVRAAHDRLVAELVTMAKTQSGQRMERVVELLLWNLDADATDAEWKESARDVPLLDQLTGERLSVAAVKGMIDLHERIRVVTTGVPAKDAKNVLDAVGVDWDVLYVTDDQVEGLKELFGDVVDVLDDTIRSATAARRYMRPEEAWHRLDGRGTPMQFVEDGFIILAGAAGNAGGDRLTFMRKNALIKAAPATDFPWYFGGLAMAISHADMPVTLAFDDVDQQSPVFGRLRGAVAVVAQKYIARRAAPPTTLAYVTFNYGLNRSEQPPRWEAREDHHAPPRSWLERPLLHALNGDDRSLEDVAAALGGHKAIGFVWSSSSEADRPFEMPDGELVLRLTTAEMGALSRDVPLKDVEQEVAILRKRALLQLSERAVEARLPAELGPVQAIDVRKDAVLGEVTGELAFGTNTGRLLLNGRRLDDFAPRLAWADVLVILDVTTIDAAGDDTSLVPKAAMMRVHDHVEAAAERLLAKRLAETPDVHDVGRLYRYLADTYTRDASWVAAVETARGTWRKPFITTPVFNTLSARKLSLDDLLQVVDATEKPIPYVREREDAPADAVPMTLRLPDDHLRLLTTMLPDERLLDARKEAHARKAVSRTLDAAPELELRDAPLSALVSTSVSMKVDGHMVRGVVWIAGPDAATAMNGPGTLFIAVRGRQLYSARYGDAPHQLRGHLTCEDLSFNVRGVVRDAVFEAVIKASERVAARLITTLITHVDEQLIDAQRMTAARCVLLSEATEHHRSTGPEAFQTHEALFSTPLFERADGQGHVSLHTLLDDLESDGEVGYLAAVAAKPALLGRDLAIVVDNALEHRGFKALFGGDGWVDYGPRLERAPQRAFEDLLRQTLDKAARTLADQDARARVAGWTITVRDSNALDWCTVSGDDIVLNHDHSRTRALLEALEAGRDVTIPLIAALGARALDGRNEAYLALLGALAATH